MSAISHDAAREIPIARLVLSTTEAQVERRKHFDNAAIAELAESIKTVGLLSPIIARPVRGRRSTGLNGVYFPHLGKDVFSPDEAEKIERDTFELVAGERRLLAAKRAGLETIAVSVRELTDEQVLEVQLVENLQREGLHELAEAEGYEALQKLGHSADEIADKVGKSKGYVYARMKLLALGKPARKAFFDGKINASIALLLARIPVEELQVRALKEITDEGGWDGPMSFREARDYIHQNFTTRLPGGFPMADATLVPAAGPCTSCPKRSGNQPQLFDDEKTADVCTDPVCFKAKREAHGTRLVAEAQAKGQEVITGTEAKKIAPGLGNHLERGFKRLDEQCFELPKSKSYKQLLGKDYEPRLLQVPETGEIIKIADPESIKGALKKAGVRDRSASTGDPYNAAQKKAQAEKRWRRSVYDAMRPKLPEQIAIDDLRTVALRFYGEMQRETKKLVLELQGLEPKKGKYNTDCDAPIRDALGGYSDAEITRLLFDLVFVRDLQVWTFSDAKPTLLLSTAKKLKVDPDKIRREMQAATKPKAKNAKRPKHQG